MNILHANKKIKEIILYKFIDKNNYYDFEIKKNVM